MPFFNALESQMLRAIAIVDAFAVGIENIFQQNLKFSSGNIFVVAALLATLQASHIKQIWCGLCSHLLNYILEFLSRKKWNCNETY